MNIELALKRQTDSTLLGSLLQAAARPISSDEVAAQRVSFAFGTLDKDSGVSKDRVREVIAGLAVGTQTK